ncbi:MAG: CHAT domain-containing protein, partial [Candidatus Electrothrix sp. ATG2]|nr:CHAT domain-containing protein [Candidatus Electrothrix sp. ATG2]
MPDETTGSAKKILILSANPKNTARLRLDEEVREISRSLKQAKYGRLFTVRQAWAVGTRDLRRELLEHEPDIVHFCGHSEEEGLLLENDQDEAVLVSSDGLAALFALCSEHVECVLLNSCYSCAQAEIISQHIPYVVGMSNRVFDKAAIEFAVGFYDALGVGKTIEESFRYGRNAIQMYRLSEEMSPVIHVRNVVSAPGKPRPKEADNATNLGRSPLSTPIMPMQNLPKRLITARQENKLIPIVGAGVSMSLKDADGERLFPSWNQLLEHAADALKKEDKEDLSEGIRIMLKLKKLQDAANLANEGLTGRLWTDFFAKYIEAPLDKVSEDTLALPKAIWAISQRIITLNYDKVLRATCPSFARLKELDNKNSAGLAD